MSKKGTNRGYQPTNPGSGVSSGHQPSNRPLNVTPPTKGPSYTPQNNKKYTWPKKMRISLA